MKVPKASCHGPSSQAVHGQLILLWHVSTLLRQPVQRSVQASRKDHCWHVWLQELLRELSPGGAWHR